MKCYLPKGCYNPNRCGDDGQCYWAAFYEVHEARRIVLEREQIPDSDVVAFGCDLESAGHVRCEKWCHGFGCPFTLSAEPATR